MQYRDIPAFMNSPFFVPEPGNWHLKEGAPKKIKKEFQEYMGMVELVNGSEDDKGVR